MGFLTGNSSIQHPASSIQHPASEDSGTETKNKTPGPKARRRLRDCSSYQK